MSREQLLARTFVELADTLVDEFDSIDLLHTLTERTVALFPVDAASLLLGDQRGHLHVVAATTQEAHMLDVFQVHTSEGPCYECATTGAPQVNIRLDDVADKWPEFHEATVRVGYRSTHSLPLRLRDQVIGALNLFSVEQTVLADDDVALGQAMADVATIGLLQERVIRQQELLSEQLQSALNNRVMIEQAKGVLSERGGLTIAAAFQAMRGHSRRTRRPLTEVATGVLDGSIGPDDLA